MKTQWICGTVLLLILGCASEKSTRVVTGIPRTSSIPVQLSLGPIAVRGADTPAAFSFDKAEGQIESAPVVAGRTSATILNGSQVPDPALRMGEDAVRFVLTPLAAVVGARKAAKERLAPDKLAECESDLAKAMETMAEQPRFRDCFLEVAGEMTHTPFTPAESCQSRASGADSPSAILETKIEELRLERTGAGDDSFALRIKSRMRLLSPGGGAVLHDQPFEYQSGTGLFLDWTLHNAFQGVAETGYRALAEQMIAQLPPASTGAPVLVGAGYRKGPIGHESELELTLASRMEATHPWLRVTRPLDSTPAVQFVAYTGAKEGGPIGVYSTARTPSIAFQRPLTKDEASSEASKDMAWHLDGLDNSPNAVVMLLACAAALPLSLWNQTVASIKGLKEKNYRTADQKLSAAAHRIRPHEAVAFEVAERLAPITAQPVVLALPDSGADPNRYFVSLPSTAPVAVTRFDNDHSAPNALASQGVENAVEVHIASIALTGKDGINPSLSLSVEAEVTLLRTRDGQPICSFPVHYRGETRKFTEWAKNNAEPFRVELDKSYRQIGRAIEEQLVSRSLVTPKKYVPALIAQH